MVERKTALVMVLLVALAVTSVGWLFSGPKIIRVESLPEGIYNWTEYFHGYQAYLDQNIFSSIIHGTSMSPTFGENDLVLWVKVVPSGLRIGDIIIFKHPTISEIDNVVHRIVEVQFDVGKYQFRTKGDNFSSSDRYYIPEANVHGLVIGVVYHDNLP
ncbi:MAG: signal peptidase I [Methanobacteriota archaeon]